MNKLIKILNTYKNFGLYSVIKIFAEVLSFISTIFIVRHFSVESYGIYSLALMIIGFTVTFGFSWNSSVILYFGSKEKAKSNTLNKTFWARNIILIITLFIVTIVYLSFYNWINTYIGASVSLILLLWLYVRIIQDYLYQYFLAIEKQKFASLLIFTSRFLFLILILLFTYNIKLLLFYRILADLSLIFYLFKINRKDFEKFEFDKQYFKEILSFSLWQLFGFSGLYIINFGDNAVIKYYMTTKDIGLYNVGYKLFNNFANLSFIISSFFAPLIAKYIEENNKVKLKKLFYNKRLFISIIVVVGHIIIFSLSDKFIVLLYGSRYLISSNVLKILLVGSLLKYLTVFYNPFYNITNRYRFLQILNIFQAVLNIVLDIILVRLYGIYGAAIATTLAISIKSIIIFIDSEKRIMNLIK